jgi:hypothetical protein
MQSALPSKDERASRGTTLILLHSSLPASDAELEAITGSPGETYSPALAGFSLPAPGRPSLLLRWRVSQPTPPPL